MTDSLSPFVYWGQKKDHISLKIDLKEASVEKLEIDEDGIKFKAQGMGVQGINEYTFELDFYHPVDKENSKYKVTETGIVVAIQKQGLGDIWPRLTEKQIKLPWLKIDFDNFCFEDDDEEDSEVERETQMMEDFERKMKDIDLTADSSPGMGYLFFYNMFQFVGYTYIFVILQAKYIMMGEEAKKSALESVGVQVMVCQVAATLEVFHGILGLVPSGILTPFLQVTGRNFMLFMILLQEPRLQEAPAIWYLFVAWSCIEVVRYPYYMLHCINLEIRLITWLRYSLWIPLYPIGILMEGILLIMAMPLFEESGKFSLSLPNFANMSFNFPLYLRLHLVLFCIGSYFLLNYMYHQRKKKLGKSTKTSAKQKLAKKTN